MDQKYNIEDKTCPICGQKDFSPNNICRECGWEYDGLKNYDSYSFTNHCTLREFELSYRHS